MSEINIEHLLERAATLEKENDYDEALRLYNRILEADPDNEIAYDRRRAIRNSTLVIVIEPHPQEKQYGYYYYLTLDGTNIGHCITGQQKVEIALGKHRLAVWRRGLADSAVSNEVVGYDFVMSEKEQTVYLRYTKKEYLHFTDLEYEEGAIEPEAVKGGCYVATAVYGSYDCPQVWTLRRYRDYTLAETWCGKVFIRTYYAISPILVKLFGQTKWFKNLWKPMLDRIVKNLNKNGVKDTPYEDIKW